MTTEQPTRCPWLDTSKPDYVKYHDEEWGVPVRDDKKMFEFIILESAQAGLSWYTILKRRAGYKKAFADFDVHTVATFDENKVEQLMQDASIIRNRAKIKAAISNAKIFITIQEEFGSFCNYLWRYVNNTPIENNIRTLADYPATSPLSDAISADLKKRGFKFFGSTICYAHLQACGLINDHSESCFRKSEVTNAQNS
ncbi:DNA-3-methyladenine glycosylase [Thalassotalea insulae]|uniref:DNA-3-methyladenine glycosylase n=1 Tax=Thalassotalea insulae TaxID=2056778 RepID=A0ABQ6GYJ7_9GAMM|nr:DNA-3-methyladenine glycosylase I [Thalassotalea insulae]GLX80407.1 DNA-3-methyladenine glycosylase [Thalassotalea insulae]